MPMATVQTGVCKCSFGSAPLPLMVSSQQTVMTCKMLQGTIMDNKFPPFGNCTSPSNPAYVAAQAAGAQCPCTPAIAAPWTPGSATVMICKNPALRKSEMLTCTLGGMIQVQQPGATTVNIGG